MNVIVADTHKLFGDRFLHETKVQFSPRENRPEISFPRNFAQPIFLNFIFNADEAMSERKRIELSTLLTETLPNEIYLPPASAPKLILISVRAHGAAQGFGFRWFMNSQKREAASPSNPRLA